MTALAPTLQAFFTTRLTSQYGASPHTVAAYRDTWRLLLGYAAQATQPHRHGCDLAQLDAALINGFLTHLQTQRHNSIATRNARLAAVHSFLPYASRYHPEHLDTIGRVLAIPPKRRPRTRSATSPRRGSTALLTAPDRTTTAGRRDHAMFQLPSRPGCASASSPRLQVRDVHLGVGAHVRCHGSSRTQISRAMPSAGLCRAAIRRTRDALSSKGIWAWGRWAARHNPGG